MAQMELVGWQQQPDGRGTFDILQTCGGTLLLLCWTSVCPNLPAQDVGQWAEWKMKINLFCLAVAGPEFVLAVAAGELNAAIRARKKYRDAGHESWTLRHCFFANMGGVHVQFLDRKREGKPSFPVNARQLLELIDRDYTPLPALVTKDQIKDRNKMDSLARTLAIIQCSWFTISSLARVAQDLHLTTMELTTLACVFHMVLCCLCWLKKPMDVSRPIEIEIDRDLTTVLQECGAPSPLVGYTPLGFLHREEWAVSTVWQYFVQLLKNIVASPEKQRKRRQASETYSFSSVGFWLIDKEWELPMLLLLALYLSIFCAAWNYPFPTELEGTLWRIASVTQLASGTVATTAGLIYLYRKDIIDRLPCISRQKTDVEKGDSTAHRARSTAVRRRCRWPDWMRNISLDADPALDVPVDMWIPGLIFLLGYSISRWYILIEDVIGLRSLPRSAYQTVDWGQYSPVF